MKFKYFQIIWSTFENQTTIWGIFSVKICLKIWNRSNIKLFWLKNDTFWTLFDFITKNWSILNNIENRSIRFDSIRKLFKFYLDFKSNLINLLRINSIKTSLNHSILTSIFPYSHCLNEVHQSSVNGSNSANLAQGVNFKKLGRFLIQDI